MFKKLMAALSLVGVVGYITIAYAAGLWPNFPVVGGATYCSGSSNSATGTIIGLVTGCPNQVPAGPTAVTGNEQIPADTRLSSGANPQTILIPMRAINALPPTYQTITNAATTLTITPSSTSGGFVIDSTAAITPAVTVFLPGSPMQNQRFYISSDQTISTLAFAVSDGSAVKNSPTVLTPSTTSTATSGYEFIFDKTIAATGTWFRLR